MNFMLFFKSIIKITLNLFICFQPMYINCRSIYFFFFHSVNFISISITFYTSLPLSIRDSTFISFFLHLHLLLLLLLHLLLFLHLIHEQFFSEQLISTHRSIIIIIIINFIKNNSFSLQRLNIQFFSLLIINHFKFSLQIYLTIDVCKMCTTSIISISKV